MHSQHVAFSSHNLHGFVKKRVGEDPLEFQPDPPSQRCENGQYIYRI